MMSGWMPISRSSLTECCVGLVLSSPTTPIIGTSVTWMYSTFSRPTSLRNWRMASRNGRHSMSPTVPPTSVMSTSTSVCSARPVHAALDLVGDVRDDLHGAAEVVAAALLGDDAVVDAAGGDVAVPLDELVDEALVVAQVEVGLGAVVGDEDLAVLERAHRARVDVDVRVELLDRDLEPALLEQPAEGCRRDALAEPADDAAGDEDVLGHAPCALLVWIPPFCTQPSSNAPVAATRERTRGTADLHETSGGFSGAGVLPVLT